MNITPISYGKNNYNTYLKTNKQAFNPSCNFGDKSKENQMDNLEFKRYKIKFSDEDEEKMKTMTLSEKIEYAKELKSGGCYKIVGIADDIETENQDETKK